MRLQLIKEGQQYKTRQGALLTVVDVIESDSNNSEYNVDWLVLEIGGIITSMQVAEFNYQVHQLINDSCHLPLVEYKEDMIKNKIEFKYNHGEIWVGLDDRPYLILRSLRSGKSRFVLYPLQTGEIWNIEDLPTSDDVELVARLTYHQPVKFGCSQVLLKDSVWDVLEPSQHSVKICSAEIEDVYDLPEELTVGFGNIIAYYPSALDYDDYREAVWACNDTKDDMVLRYLRELEHELVCKRWMAEGFMLL